MVGEAMILAAFVINLAGTMAHTCEHVPINEARGGRVEGASSAAIEAI